MINQEEKDMEEERKKYALGAIVILSPVPGERGPKGKVIGVTSWLDGTTGYVVLTFDGLSGRGYTQHQVSGDFIQPVPL